MTEPWCRGISPVQEDRIKRAVEGTCELCREYTPCALLGLHGLAVPAGTRNPAPKECERHIVIVCESCHRLIHAEPVPVQKLLALIERRPFEIRRGILRALGYVPQPVTPPDDQDYARVYDETLKNPSGHSR